MKVVIVLDRQLPAGLLANAAAVLGFSVARHLPGGFGPDVADRDGSLHPGITNLPIPILACDEDQLPGLRDKAMALQDVQCVDFTEVAQRSKGYDEYTSAMNGSAGAELKYLGLCLCGDPRAVRRLTGHLPLVR